MRKRKIAAVVMALAMTAGISSPVQAAGYCINGNGSNCQVVVGGNCLGGNSVNEILNGISCNNGNSVKGASDNNNCNAGNCADINSSCNTQNGGNCSNSSNNCNILNGGNCANSANSCNNAKKSSVDASSCLTDALQKYISGGNACGSQASAQAGTKSGNTCQSTTPSGNSSGSVKQSANTIIQNGNICQPTTKNSNTCQSAAKSSNSCQTIIQYGNSCQTVTGNNSASQPVSQNRTTEQATTQRTSEQSTTQLTTERPTAEQPATQATTEQPAAEKENSTEAATPAEPKTEDVTVGSMSEDQASAAGQVLDLVNQNRSSAGLHTLRLDAELCAAAQIRANEIVSSFSHTRPDGRKFSTVLTDNGIRFTAAGENIAWGQTSSSQVMNAWMNSDGHRANIMNSTYTKLGVGHVTVGGRQYWVQLFSY